MFPDDADIPTKVIQYDDRWVPTVAHDGIFDFTGGIVYRTPEAAEAAIPQFLEFTKRFWQRQSERAGGIVAGHTHYRLGDPTATRADHRGFGGREFRFESLATGEVTVSNNVWCQGDLPDFLRPFFPETHRLLA